MELAADEAAGVVTKSASNQSDRRRLEVEAGILRTFAHPGVVQMVGADGDPPERLVLRMAGGGDLRSVGVQSLEVVAGLGAALATTVADLHDLGVVHRSIDESHVLLDEAGRPLLCSFGRARSEVREVTARREDLSDLARLLLDRLPPSAARSRAAAAIRAAGSGRRGRDARWLARRLVELVPDARLPGWEEPVGRPRVERGHRGGLRWGLLIGTAIASGAVATLMSGGGSGSRGAVAAACPVVDEGCGPLTLNHGVLSLGGGRYQLTGADVVVLGRWGCGPLAYPAVLQAVDGDVWVFSSWAKPGRPEFARLIGTVRSASGLRTAPQRSGCDLLIVDRRGKGPVAMNLSRVSA